MSISPADPAPLWWTDIRRARDTALRDLEQILTCVDRTLSEPLNLSRQTLQTNLNLWSDLNRSAVKAAEAVRASCRLAESRSRDALLSGFTPPADDDLAERGRNTSREMNLLSLKLKKRLMEIAQELNRRHHRPRSARTYGGHYPSQIDVHV